MTFTDEDLNKLKFVLDYSSKKWLTDWKINALLARLEAAEKALKGCIESDYSGDPKDLDEWERRKRNEKS